LSASERLVQDAATLGVTLTSADAARLLTLSGELARWNRSYNLTAISSPAAMVTHHLLDSLAVNADLAGTRIADAGTGAGFPDAGEQDGGSNCRAHDPPVRSHNGSAPRGGLLGVTLPPFRAGLSQSESLCHRPSGNPQSQ